MAGFDPEVFGGTAPANKGFDADVFNAPSAPVALAAQAATAPQAPGWLDTTKSVLQMLSPVHTAAALFSPEGRAGIVNNLAGGVRGAGSIGATLMAPIDVASDALAGRGLTLQSNRERRQSMDQALTTLGADTTSAPFQVGKLGTEIGGTYAVGGVLANGLSRIPGATTAAPGLLNAIRTGGMTTGAAPTGLLSRAADLATRSAGAIVNNAATAGLVDPEAALPAAAIGAVTPPILMAAGKAGSVISNGMETLSKRLMQSAIKPTLAQLQSGDAATAADVLLQRGLNPSPAGVEKLGTAIDDVDAQIANAIAGSNTRVSKAKVLDALDQTRAKFAMQATPQNDLAAIQNAGDAFLAHPQFPRPTIAVQDAQALKRGTYQVLAGKYGEQGSASTEAQKAIARGLKEQIANAVPEVAPLNQELGQLLVARDVAARRALMEQNKNPLGLAALAPTKAGLLTFLADRSALAKSLAARGLYSTANAGPGLLDPQLLLPLARSGALLSTEVGQ